MNRVGTISMTNHTNGPVELKHHHVIVAGYGPVGRMVTEQLENAGLKVTIVELNLDTIEKRLDRDKQVVYGDIIDPEVLQKAGIEHADALILAIPNEDKALQACRVVREFNPDIFIAARTNYLSKGMLCTAAGADYVVVEEVVTAQAMQEAVVHSLLGK